jgi:hypothetical protein
MRCSYFFGICLAVIATTGASAERPYDYMFTRDIKGHHIEVRLKLKAFDPKQHKLEKKDGLAYVDGMIPIGTDNSFSISTQFCQFDVFWDGQLINIPKSYYADLFNASLAPKVNPAFDTTGSVWTSVADDGQAVLIEFEGSEAGGAYKAWLIIRRDGKHQRFVENTTP